MSERGLSKKKMIIHNHSQNYFRFITFRRCLISIYLYYILKNIAT